MFPVKRLNDLLMSCMPWRQKKKFLHVKPAPASTSSDPFLRLLELGLSPEEISRLRELGLTAEEIVRLTELGLTPDEIFRLKTLGLSPDEILRMREEIARASKSKEAQTGSVQQIYDDSNAKQQSTDVVYGNALTPAPAAQWEASRRSVCWDPQRADEHSADSGCHVRHTRGFMPLPPTSPVTSVSPCDPDKLTKGMRDFRVIYTEDPWVRMQMDKLRRSLVGMCEHCKEPIYNEGLKGLSGRLYHPHHFSCSSCFTAFGVASDENSDTLESHQATFFEHNGQAFCTGCYLASFAPKCHACGAPIGNDRGGAIAALGATYHAACFECCNCRERIGDAQVFMEHEGNAYCRGCYLDKFLPKCSECGLPIEDRYLSVFGKNFHRNCFYCIECCDDGSSLVVEATDANHPDKTAVYYYVYEGEPHCKTHYEDKAGLECCHCGRKIVGRCMAAMSRQFNDQQFVCAFCQRHLAAPRFFEISVPQAVIRNTKKDQWTQGNYRQDY